MLPVVSAGAPAKQLTPEQQVELAAKTAKSNLSYGTFDWVIKDGEARQAMTALTTLPAELRGPALSKLTPTEFSRLLTEVPSVEREQLRELVDSCSDPERKLRLFAAAHNSRVDNDVAKENAKTKDDKGKNQARDQIAKNTHDEIDAEAAFLLAKVKGGKLDAAGVQKYIAGKEKEHQAEMNDTKNIAGTLDGFGEAERVEYALQQVQKLTQTGLSDWAVTDREATESHELLRSLPKDLRAKALVQLGTKQFQKLLSNIPDSKDQLNLWAEYHSVNVKNDAAQERAKTQDEGTLGSQTDAQKENQRLNTRRNEIVTSTDGEIQDEVEFLANREKNGGPPLTGDDVEKLMQRKDREHQIEMKYNVNLTTKRGVRPYDMNASFSKGTKIFWSESELEQIESGLARMPAEHVRGNKLIKSIKRSDIDLDDEIALLTKSAYELKYGGDHLDGVIRVQDLGVNGTYRNTGDARELQDPELGTLGGGKITPVEETIVHEFGHDMHYDPAKGKDAAGDDQFSDARAHFVAAGGWKADGTFDPNRIPSLDSWSYARTRPNEHFAEVYMKAVLKPETLACDLLDAPRARLQDARDNVSAAERKIARLRTVSATEAQIKAAEQRRDNLARNAQDAEDDRVGQEQQFTIMRNEVFHTDQITTSAVQRLRDKGISEEKIKEFQERAGRASTPHQVALIEKGFIP